MEFKPKDLVKCAFFRDEVFELQATGMEKCPLLIIKDNFRYYFSSDGKFHPEHPASILTLVERSNEKFSYYEHKYLRNGSLTINRMKMPWERMLFYRGDSIEHLETIEHHYEKIDGKWCRIDVEKFK